MTEQVKLWKSEFGNDYAKRNELTEDFLLPRRRFWDNMLRNIYFADKQLPTSFLEVGAGAGANLLGIRNVYNMNAGEGRPSLPHELFATEVHDETRQQLQVNVPGVNVIDSDKLHQFVNRFDVVYTSGVLIHTHPAHRIPLMRDIYNASKRYVICIEYFAPETRMIPYRGENNALWLDDYGSLYLDNFGLRVVTYGFAWKRTTGLDNVTYWIFEKVN